MAQTVHDEQPVAAVGHDGVIYATNSVTTYAFDPANPAAGWITLPAQPNRHHHIGPGITVGLDGKIYLIAGAFVAPYNTLTEVYDPANASAGWVTLPATLNTGRRDLAAVTGSDGKIYAIGGYNDGVTVPLSSVEAYDPANPSAGWVTLPAALNTGRQGHVAVTGPDGRIYVIGGQTSLTYLDGALSSVEVYDPANPAAGWSVLPASLNAPRTYPCATVGIDGTLYAISGHNSQGGTFGQDLNTVETYATGWNLLYPQLGTQRAALALTAGSDGLLYAVGGIDLNGNPLDSTEVYDPRYAAYGWSALAGNLQTPRYGLAATTGSDGLLYAVGGRDTSTIYGVTEAYDPTAPFAGWFALPTLNTPRYEHALISAADGKLYAIGGIARNAATLGTVEVYDPNASTPKWTAGKSLKTPRFRFGAVAAPDGKVYAIGGGNSSGAVFNSVEVFDPSHATLGWSALPASLNTARKDLTATVGANGRLYAIGGKDTNGNLLTSIEVYDPANPGAGWTLAANSLNTARADCGAVTGSDDRLYVVGGTGASGTLGSVETLPLGVAPVSLTVDDPLAPANLIVTLAAPAPTVGALLTLNYSPAVSGLQSGVVVAAGTTQAAIPISSSSITQPTTVTASFQGHSTSITLNPIPAIQSVSPSPLLVGSGAQSLTINGTGFLATSTVFWNGKARTAHYVSPTGLTADLLATDVATAENATVQVANPAPYGGRSTQLVVPVAAPNLAMGNTHGLRSEAGELLFRVTLTNNGNIAAPNVTLLSAKLGTAPTDGKLPLSLGSINVGQSGLLNVTFPGKTGTKGSQLKLALSGTYGAGQAWTASLTVTLP
jgi:N-acetylneuraminic acid mutarotase